MSDYGHDLLFGSFVTPTAQQPQQAVLLAQASEQAGLDLVTFQDHPYQPAFLDTWTLLSYAAARTSRIRLSANVVNLPLRPPAVLAKAAASLVLTQPGLADIVAAVQTSRRIYQRMLTYALNASIKKLEVPVFLSVILLALGVFPLTPRPDEVNVLVRAARRRR